MNNLIRNNLVTRHFSFDRAKLKQVIIRTLSIDETFDEMEERENPVPKYVNPFFGGQLKNFSWLYSSTLGFPLDGNNIRVLHEPSQFYETLLEKCKTAKFRITLASLYLGTGDFEQKLVDAIEDSLVRQNDKLKVKVLLDFTRGSRGVNNSRSMLLPMMKEHKDSCQVALYHTPVLRGFLRKVQRYNELVGLQHMKLYIFDDSLIISGANLSKDYFTNRQDRYFLIEDCKELADFYDVLVTKVSRFSFQLDKNNVVSLHPEWDVHPIDGDRKRFEEKANKMISDHISRASCLDLNADKDTWVFPLIQMGQLGVNMDSQVTTKIIETATADSKIDLATGYFNLTRPYINSILQRSHANYNILMAHPNANGFLNARGPAYGIPFGYTLIASTFINQVTWNRQQHRIKMNEYQRKGWTYHAKGLWQTLPGEASPSLTLVGSPNFGGRSVKRDLETQVAIVTKNASLRACLNAEKERLYALGSNFSEETFLAPDRIPPLWVYLVVGLFRDVF